VHDWNLTNFPYLHTWTLMSEAFEASYKAVESELGRHDTTLAQFNMLLILDHCKTALTPGQLAAYTFREQHSVSAQLSRMRKAGLVKKTRSTKDQRVVTVKITPKGRELLDRVKPAGLGLAQDIIKSCFSENELGQFDEQLRKVRDCALQRLGREAKPVPPIFRIPETAEECLTSAK
jgi:DNA-binding MarR family transcriptional regulator